LFGWFGNRYASSTEIVSGADRSFLLETIDVGPAAAKADLFETLEMSTVRTISFLLRRVGSHGGGVARAKRLAAFPVAGMKEVVAFLTTHSTLAAQFAEQIGLADEVRKAIRQGYEQWDGKGYPQHSPATSVRS
jgi:hypothetical protein